MMEFKLEQIKDVLQRTPSTLNALLHNLPDELVLANEGGESWSVYDTVGHLIHCEEADWIPRANMILNYGESRTFDPFDRFAMFEKSKGKSLSELLDQFVKLRAENLHELDRMNITSEVLKKQGNHPDFGLVTMQELLTTWMVHDFTHIAQIVRVMAKQYDELVGPWKAYLSILKK
jgi:uncharacterized damage-inducible protein DinB